MTDSEPDEFRLACRNSIIFCSFILLTSLVIGLAIPAKEKVNTIPLSAINETDNQITAEFGTLCEEAGFTTSKITVGDDGLNLYRQPSSRGAVEWFYLHVTGDREITMAILEEAEKNNIPLSLAFALAFTESHYNNKAVNKNKNASIDRGLFQLNNKSFPQLKESDFYDPAVSAKYGMSHLRFCMNVAGNEVTALAMYNAGTSKVRSNNTPQSTLVYVGKIMAYRDKLDKLFSEEVMNYYDSNFQQSGISVAWNGSRKFSDR